MTMSYPGRVIKLGETDARIVKAVKTALNRALVIQRRPEERLDVTNPHFGPRTKQAVQLFQAQYLDAEGRPLKMDGEIGSITWAALFGADSVPLVERSDDALLARALDIAAGE